MFLIGVEPWPIIGYPFFEHMVDDASDLVGGSGDGNGSAMFGFDPMIEGA